MERLEKQKLTKMRGKTKKRHKHQRSQTQALVKRLAELVQVLVLLQVVPVPEQDTRHMFWGRNDG